MTNEKVVSAREYIGAATRMAIDFINQRAPLAAEVRKAASAPTIRVLDSPPWPFAWHASSALDELETLVARFAGREACVDLGLNAGRKLGGTVIEPVLRMAMGLFGRNPGVVFGNLDRFYSMVARGVGFVFEPGGPTSGVVRLRAEGANVPPALFDVVRGNLQYVFELCGVEGSVDAGQILSSDAAGTSVSYAARWS